MVRPGKKSKTIALSHPHSQPREPGRIVGICLITAFLATCAAATGKADTRAPSDCESLAGVFTKALTNILKTKPRLQNSKVLVSYSPRCTPPEHAREAVEVVLTGLGASITDEEERADLRLTVSLTEARVILVGDDGRYCRTISVTVHAMCVDSSGKVLFAEGRNETVGDTVPAEELDSTDDGNRFCGNVERHVIERGGLGLRVYSLVLLSALLVFFAFQ